MVSDSVNKSRQNITLAHFLVQNYVIKKKWARKHQGRHRPSRKDEELLTVQNVGVLKGESVRGDAGLLLGLIGDTYRRLFWVSMRSRLYALMAVSTSRISDDLCFLLSCKVDCTRSLLSILPFFGKMER